MTIDLDFKCHCAHSIYLTGDKRVCHDLPEPIQANIRSMKRHHRGIKHELYQDDELRHFLEAYFDKDVIEAWDNLVPLAYKADLGRYCLLYQKGGLYADLSIFFTDSMLDQRMDPRKIIVFRDAPNEAPWIVSNSLMMAPPGQAAFEMCISEIVKNVREGYYGANPLSPTGPNLVGLALATTTDARLIECGQASGIGRIEDGLSFGYVNRGGRLVAISHKAGRGIFSLDGVTKSCYNKEYNRGTIYSSGVRSWDAVDYYIHRWCPTGSIFQGGRGAALVIEAQDCHILFGPYAPLGPGLYEAIFDISLVSGMSPMQLIADIVDEHGSKIVASNVPLRVSEANSSCQASITFKTDEYLHSFELRVYLGSSGTISFRSLTVTHLEA